jgi:hypothetical protein
VLIDEGDRAAMRSLLVLLTAALLSVGAVACSSSGKSSASSTRSSLSPSATVATTTTGATTASTNTGPAPAETKADADKDNDVGAPNDDTNNNSVLNYGSEASPADKRAVAAVLKRYYALAAADEGTEACAMLDEVLSEAVAEDYGKGSAGPSYLKAGTSCPQVMDLLFVHYRNQLAVELPKLEVARVRLIGHRGFAILHFGRLPEREISVVREGHVWKLGELLDSEVL